MYLSFSLEFNTPDEFITYWASKYQYKLEYLYEMNIGKQLTKKSVIELFTWKNGFILSNNKMESLVKNYNPNHNEDLEKRYLNPKQSGGPIWNIFYLHCNNPTKYPIFDQHTFRAMKYIKNGKILELPKDKAEVYNLYKKEYMEFIKELSDFELRKNDKALFTFGRFLKNVKNFV